MDLNRGDLIVAAFQGDYGKPRPALVVQSQTALTLQSVTVLPITSDLKDLPLLRVDIAPSDQNGLRRPSQIMVDKITTIPRSKVDRTIGSIKGDVLTAATRYLALHLGIA